MKAMLLVMVLSLSSITWGASINYSENFASWAWDTPIPVLTGVNPASGYWYTETGNSVFGGVTWGAAMDGKKLYVNNTPSFAGNVSKNFRLDDTLSVAENFTKPTVTARVQNDGGPDDAWWLNFRISLLDANGNGYVGAASRGGAMGLYRLDNGTSTLLGTSGGIGGNTRTISLDVNNGVVTFSYYYTPDTQYVLPVADAKYSQFTTIGIGGDYGYYEHLSIDDVSLNATIVPEPVTISILGIGVLLGFFRRK